MRIRVWILMALPLFAACADDPAQPVLPAVQFHASADMQLALSAGSSCAISGALTYCWGWNHWGQLGNNSGNQMCDSWVCRPNPRRVVTTQVFTKIFGGQQPVMCGITDADRLYCWGNNNFGMMGRGLGVAIDNVGYLVPRPLNGYYLTMAIGEAHACAIRTNQTMACWGSNRYGQLGSTTATGDCGFASPCSDSPIRVPDGRRYTAVTAGRDFTCAIATDNEVYCWGNSFSVPLGSPIPRTGTGAWAQVSGGGTHACVLDQVGAAFCWGGDGNGQLGNGAASDSPVPTPVSGGHTFSEIHASESRTCGLTTAGSVYCWGFNAAGLLGDGTITQRDVPVKVLGTNTYLSLAVSNTHTCANASGLGVYCWGPNELAQLGRPRFEKCDITQPNAFCASRPRKVVGGVI